MFVRIADQFDFIEEIWVNSPENVSYMWVKVSRFESGMSSIIFSFVRDNVFPKIANVSVSLDDCDKDKYLSVYKRH